MSDDKKGKADTMYWRGRSYDMVLGPLLRGPRRWIARRVLKNDLFPVLDICCGTGDQCGTLAGQGRLVVGLDLDFNLLRYAAWRHPNIPFVCADAMHLPFRARSFKAIGISYALHDKSPLTRLSMMAEARRVLRPRGWVFILDFEMPWSLRSRLGSMAIAVIERLAGQVHFRNGRQFLSNGGLRAFLPQHGLKVLKRRTIEIGASSLVVAAFSIIRTQGRRGPRLDARDIN